MECYIYSIRSHQTKDIYIGSTKQKLSSRMSGHRRNYRSWINKKFDYISSFELLKYEDAYIELIEKVEVKTNQELRKLEGEHIRKIDCVNKLIAGRTQKENYEEKKEQILKKAKENRLNNIEKFKLKDKKYQQENKIQIADYQQKYRQQNKKQIVEKSKEKYTCDCGTICRIREKNRHNKSKKHINFLNLILV